jgi:hypothetical protein
MTPHPRVHALQADKRNLITLGDDALLAAWGVRREWTAHVLRNVVPTTQAVTPANADDCGHSASSFSSSRWPVMAPRRPGVATRSRARLWAEVIAGGFVAQALVHPSERLVDVDGTPTRLKLDLRAYAWRGQVQLLAARTWAGQTTNFRTEGGGFSPVVVLPALPL